MSSTIGRAKHGAMEALASAVKGGMERVALQEEGIENLVAVLLVYVPPMALSPDILHAQEESLLSMLIVDDLPFRYTCV